MRTAYDYFTGMPRPVWVLRRYTDKQMQEVTRTLKQDQPDRKKKKERILCRTCSNVITTLDRKIQIDGMHTHTFKNPAGIVYTIGCFSSTTGCFNFGDPTKQHTWFPGYAWSYSNCVKCFMHLGWFYQSDDTHFYGLILDNLTVGEKESL